MIPFSTYLRIETMAGGGDASVRDMIKATKAKLRKGVSRADRHAIYRSMLERHAEVKLYRHIRS